MDYLKIGKYIKKQRQLLNLTQKELAEKLNISFQAVSKWETGETLPDTSLLLELSNILNTSVDLILNGGAITRKERKLMKLAEIEEGFNCLEKVRNYFGADSSFYKGMIDGINKSMNIDIEEYLKDEQYRQVMYAEVIIQGILNGRTIDIKDIENNMTNQKMIKTIKEYYNKTK